MPTANARPPVATTSQRLRRQPSGTFESLYTTTYISPMTRKQPIQRTASDTFLYQLSRQQRTQHTDQGRAEDEQDEQELSLCTMLCLTICMAGVQFTWTVELAYGTPYLLSFDIPKEMTALVWLAGPLSGLLIQPIIGAFSDVCTSSLGRRRPFILGGAVFVCMSMLGVAFAKEIGAWAVAMSGVAGTPENIAEKEHRAAIAVAIFAFYTLDFSLNAVQASCRALILDIPPLWQQQMANAWAARLSNVAMVVGYFTGFVNLVALFPMLGDSQVKVFCLVAIAVLVSTIGVTCCTIHEKPTPSGNEDRPWYSMFTNIWHSFRSLPHSIQRLCNVQFFAWLGWFPFLFYSTTWISEIYFATHPTESPDKWADGTRAGSFALLLYAIVSVISGIVLPWMAIQYPTVLSMKNIYTAGNLIFSLCMLSTIMAKDVVSATVIVALIGIPWSIVLWVPFALVGEYINVALPSPTPDRSLTASPSYGAINDMSAPQEQGLDEGDEDEDELYAGMVLGVHNIYIVFPQFAVAIIAALIFRFISWIEHGSGERYKDGPNTPSVTWVLLFSGVMGLVATVLSRRIVEVSPSRRDELLTTGAMSDRISV